MFATQMYKKLGTGGASSLLGGIAVSAIFICESGAGRSLQQWLMSYTARKKVLFIPVPWVLMKYGHRIRMMSKNAVVLE